jgi:hypothetical protein
MRVTMIHPPGAHFAPLMTQLAIGIAGSGDELTSTARNHGQFDADALVCWGWHRGARIRKTNPNIPLLVMERGYVGDRFHWTSLGWNGLNGRAVFPKIDLSEEHATGASLARLWKAHGSGWRPWRPIGTPPDAPPGYALILGQVPSDAACKNVNLPYQYRQWFNFLVQRGHTVKFRPHPKALHAPSGIHRSSYTRGTLAEDLAGAKFTVSWNSNSSVDSILAGVPSVTFDQGSMAWSVSSHDLANPVTMPSRTEWAAQLAWCQWQPSELADGTAWKAVREAMP